MSQISLSNVSSLAYSQGFSACGVCRVERLSGEGEKLQAWLSSEMHGEMGYMERNVDKRLDPTRLVPGAKSIISVLLSYYPGNPAIVTQSPKMSRYALSVDYHTVLKSMLWKMLDMLRQDFGSINGRAFVDSAPVLERAWAQRAGLGWIGKNSMLISPTLGSYTFIGELIVDVDIEPSTSLVPNRCGTCTRCIDACPAGAIVAPGVIDARKCISYLTIEKKAPLTEDESNSLNDWCFGCDICQEVCPWNKRIEQHGLKTISPKKEVLELFGNALKDIAEEQFNHVFGNTPVARTGYKKIKENIK